VLRRPGAQEGARRHQELLDVLCDGPDHGLAYRSEQIRNPRGCRHMRAVHLISAATIVSGMSLVAISAPASAAPPRHLPSCAAARMLCAEITESEEAFGQYVGHDEPELNFYSAQPGSRNNMRYSFTLPKDPRPSADHRFPHTFQLRPALWLRMDL